MSSSKTKGKKKRKKKEKKDKRREELGATIPQPTEIEKDDLSNLRPEKSTAPKKELKEKDRETKFDVELEKRGEELSISVSHPKQPESITPPKQREQGEIRYSDRMRRLAKKIRKRRKRRR
jgi:hypothetical protein